MRTNIVIDDGLIADAMRASGSKTKREAVERGLRKLVQLERQQDILELFGKIDWDGDLDEMRRD